MSRPIIITGCARSGTSLIAGVVHKCGAWMGNITGKTVWNKKGQFENIHIRDVLTKGYLKKIGADPMGQDPLPRLKPTDFEVRWSSDVIFAINNEGYKGGPWAFKGAKACLIWPIWNNAFPKASWVVVRRDPERIVDSCMRTSFMRKRKTRESWMEWVWFHEEKFEEIRLNCSRTYEIWPDSLFREDGLGGLQVLVKSLGLMWNDKEVREFIDPKLWHG